MISIEYKASSKMGEGRNWHVLAQGETKIAGKLCLGEFQSEPEAKAFAATLSA